MCWGNYCELPFFLESWPLSLRCLTRILARNYVFCFILQSGWLLVFSLCNLLRVRMKMPSYKEIYLFFLTVVWKCYNPSIIYLELFRITWLRFFFFLSQMRPENSQEDCIMASDSRISFSPLSSMIIVTSKFFSLSLSAKWDYFSLACEHWNFFLKDGVTHWSAYRMQDLISISVCCHNKICHFEIQKIPSGWHLAYALASAWKSAFPL